MEPKLKLHFAVLFLQIKMKKRNDLNVHLEWSGEIVFKISNDP
jgi:hypothetical protein